MIIQKKMEKATSVGSYTLPEMKFQKRTQEGDSDHPGKEIQEAGLLLVLKILGVQIF
jgi:hypothetical protein